MNGCEVVLKFLVCISCGSGNLEQQRSGSPIICRECAAAYPVINGVPCFVPDDSLNFSEVAPVDREKFLAMKRLAYSGDSIVSRMYNHYHLYAARRRQERGGGGLTVDIGFGIGEHYPFITEKEKAASSFVGVDLDRFKLEHFTAVHPEVPVLQASALNLPFAAGAVSTVQLLATLEHFTSEELAMVVAEALRVLKKGGLLIACYPAEGGLLLKLCRKMMHRYFRSRTGFDLDSEKMHQHPSTAAQINKTLAGRGDLKKVASSYYPLGIRNLDWALFLNETYVRI